MNPIKKVVTGHAVSFSGGGVITLKSWSYECECGKTQRGHYYGRKMETRKQARDAYHEHRKKEHGGLGASA